jgi:hypothetical protein
MTTTDITIDVSRTLLSDAWEYAYFDLLKASKSDSPLYAWGALDSSELCQLLSKRVDDEKDGIFSEVLDKDEARLYFAELVGISVSLLRNTLRSTGMAIDFYPTFYLALGAYTIQEYEKADGWTDATLKDIVHRLLNGVAVLLWTVDLGEPYQLIHEACDVTVLSLMLLARMRD